jgi:hypothetical protein
LSSTKEPGERVVMSSTLFASFVLLETLFSMSIVNLPCLAISLTSSMDLSHPLPAQIVPRTLSHQQRS